MKDVFIMGTITVRREKLGVSGMAKPTAGKLGISDQMNRE